MKTEVVQWRCRCGTSSVGRTLARADPQHGLNQAQWSKPTISAQKREKGPKVKVTLSYLITATYGMKVLCDNTKNQ